MILIIFITGKWQDGLYIEETCVIDVLNIYIDYKKKGKKRYNF